MSDLKVTAQLRERLNGYEGEEGCEQAQFAAALLETLIEFGLKGDAHLAHLLAKEVLSNPDMANSVLAMAVGALTDTEKNLRLAHSTLLDLGDATVANMIGDIGRAMGSNEETIATAVKMAKESL